jgi:trimethylamine--corrinoid protein Co-methyltransferase
VGFLDCADIGSLEMLVMSDEVIAMTKRIMRGIEISDETLMLDLIDRIGPGGEFMSTKETARMCRTEIWSPTLMDRQPWVSWEELGSTRMADRVKVKLQRILSSHQPPPLPPGVAEQIEAVLSAAEPRRREAG